MFPPVRLGCYDSKGDLDSGARAASDRSSRQIHYPEDGRQAMSKSMNVDMSTSRIVV